MKENIINLINDILKSKNREFLFQTRCERIYMLLNDNNILKEKAIKLNKLLKEKNEYILSNNNYSKIIILLEEIKNELMKSINYEENNN